MSEPAVILTTTTIAEARALQRKGFTLSEISDRLSINVELITQFLYWSVVQK